MGRKELLRPGHLHLSGTRGWDMGISQAHRNSKASTLPAVVGSSVNAILLLGVSSGRGASGQAEKRMVPWSLFVGEFLEPYLSHLPVLLGPRALSVGRPSDPGAYISCLLSADWWSGSISLESYLCWLSGGQDTHVTMLLLLSWGAQPAHLLLSPFRAASCTSSVVSRIYCCPGS